MWFSWRFRSHRLPAHSHRIERLSIILIADPTGSQNLFQSRPLHFVVIGDGNDLPGWADENDVLGVLSTFEAQLPLEDLAMLLPARKRQIGK
jgi:hypothetical protein